MDTFEESFSKQYMNSQELNYETINEDTLSSLSSIYFSGKLDSHNLQFEQNAHLEPLQVLNIDEPIDLTTMNNKHVDNASQSLAFTIPATTSNELLSNQPNDFIFQKRRKRRKFAYTPDGKVVLVPNDIAFQSPPSFSGSKQLEILMAAKSLFSKRTRTLYHWMYPNAAKHQIKAAVANSWISLGTEEKDFYISQVLGRFGFAQSSLMVNPQLGGIKESPMLENIAPVSATKSRPNELQNAISSITSDNVINNADNLNDMSLTFEQFEEINEKMHKRKRGRPKGSCVKKSKRNSAGGSGGPDFQDDPELSQELQQFATIFNLNKV